MKFEISQKFYFEAAHTLQRQIDVESSRRIHGHTYRAEITLRGTPAADGMVVDLGVLRAAIERVRLQLDHRFLDDVPELGAPTLEHLCAYLWRQLEPEFAALERVVVSREASGDSCTLTRS